MITLLRSILIYHEIDTLRLDESKRVNKGGPNQYCGQLWIFDERGARKREERKIRDSFISSISPSLPLVPRTELPRAPFTSFLPEYFQRHSFLRWWCHLYQWFPPLLSVETDVTRAKQSHPKRVDSTRRRDDITLNSSHRLLSSSPSNIYIYIYLFTFIYLIFCLTI